MGRIKLFLLVSLYALTNGMCGLAVAAPRWNAAAFREMSPGDRYRYVHDYPLEKMHNPGGSLTALLNEMLRVAVEKDDRHTLLAVKYYFAMTSGPEGVVLPKGQNSYMLWQEIEREAGSYEFPVEELVAHFHLIQHPFNPNVRNFQKKYTDVQETFERMQSIGFTKFKDYGIETVLLDMAMFMWGLEDYEKALRYLTVAERFIVQTEEGGHAYTQVLSYLQTYWKQKKEYARSLAYAYKIKRYHEHLSVDSDAGKWWNDFWKGYSDIEIADLLIRQGKLVQSEKFADDGYLKSKASARYVDEASSNLAEYDALQVLIDVKLRLGKLPEAQVLLQRALTIKAMLEEKGQFDYFKPIRLYQYLARYNEQTGHPALALKYTQQAQLLQDSLDTRNDAHKLAKAQQRVEAEKYAHKIAGIESEKKIEKMQKNATIVLLALVLAWGVVYYKKVQAGKKRKQNELNKARSDLEALTRILREKSEQADKLREENEKLYARGKRSEYLDLLANATILTDDDWTNFRSIFEKVYPDFIAGQKERYSTITPAETRLIVLEKLGLNTQEMANTLGVNKNTIHQTRLRLRKKTEGVSVFS